MSGVGVTGDQSAFNARTMLLITAIGALAFIAMLTLGAYAPDLRSGHNGGSHALSNGATGYSGLVRLAQATGRNPQIVRSTDPQDWASEDLAVVTPDSGYDKLGDIIQARGPRATLIVMPKWNTVADETHPGWVKIRSLKPAADPEYTLAPGLKLRVTRIKAHGEPLVNVDRAAPASVNFLSPAVVQTMSGKDLRPIITTASGKIVLAKTPDGLYLLSEPDLLNNHAMGDKRQAASALALLDFLNSTGADGVLFDVTVNGLGRSRSPLKLAFDAPFLAVTLVIFTAMLLAAWQALVRFGPVRHPQRAIAFGKAALVDNSAALVRKAAREARLGTRYVDVIREQAIASFGLPPNLEADVLAARLEALNTRRSFSAAARAAAIANSRDELLKAARSLHFWFEEIKQ